MSPSLSTTQSIFPVEHEAAVSTETTPTLPDDVGPEPMCRKPEASEAAGDSIDASPVGPVVLAPVDTLSVPPAADPEVAPVVTDITAPSVRVERPHLTITIPLVVQAQLVVRESSPVFFSAAAVRPEQMIVRPESASTEV